MHIGMLEFSIMKGIIYCKSKFKEKDKSLPFSCQQVTTLKDILNSDCPIMIFREDFLKRRPNLNFSSFENKTCLIHFCKKDVNNIKVSKELGALDYFTDEDNIVEINFKIQLAKKVSKLQKEISDLNNRITKKNSKIEEITLGDPLTGCNNWRHFLRSANEELTRSRENDHSVSFINIDVDNFRRVNEIYGVQVADILIKELVELLKKNLRKDDVLFRWRTDEFFIVIPYSGRMPAYEAAKRIQKKITEHKFKFKKIVITIKTSIGVVSFPEDNVSSIRDVISALDMCRISAKRKGGNAIVVYTQPSKKVFPKVKIKGDIKELRGRLEKMDLTITRDLVEMIYGFARAIEAKDSCTGKHVEYTAVIAEKIAKTLKLSKEEIANIKHAAILHDLGKVGICQSILSKKGVLNTEEREIIKTHPSIAAEILREIHVLRGAIPSILYHHERYDGKGYPLGIKGEDIPLGARIIAISDVYEALISDRPYRKAFSKKKALEIIEEGIGTQFDPNICKIFLQIIKEVDGK
ncbi:MAG: diguanylate cyclase [Candidatus Omnitrophica bacterium]|nr:diguanylate cyclase [Candidatus Omnitrophota bacterium]